MGGGNSLSIMLNVAQTIQLGGTGLDSIEDVNVTSSNASITWSASIGPGQSPTSLQVVATPSLVPGGQVPSGNDQVMVDPVGSGYSLSDQFYLNGTGPIQCTVTSTGTVYNPTQQLALVAKYAAAQ